MDKIILDKSKKSSDWLHSVVAKNPMNKVIKKSDDDIEKSKVYFQPEIGEKPPKGAKVMRGRKGGYYYESGGLKKPALQASKTIEGFSLISKVDQIDKKKFLQAEKRIGKDYDTLSDDPNLSEYRKDLACDAYDIFYGINDVIGRYLFEERKRLPPADPGFYSEDEGGPLKFILYSEGGEYLGGALYFTTRGKRYNVADISYYANVPDDHRKTAKTKILVVKSLATDPRIVAYRSKRGIGTNMMIRLMELAVKNDCSHLELEPLKSAIPFYEKFGLVREGRDLMKIDREGMINVIQEYTKLEGQRIEKSENEDWLEDLYDLEEKYGAMVTSRGKLRKSELERGIEVEYEHGTGKMSEAASPDTNVTDDDPVKTAKIAIAHLRELPDYYTRLDEMEEEGKENLSNIEKSKKYISRGQPLPEDKEIKIGPRGGRYYETDEDNIFVEGHRKHTEIYGSNQYLHNIEENKSLNLPKDTLFYHVTPIKNVESILKQGLIIGAKPHFGFEGEYLKGVWLGIDPRDATGNIEEPEQPEKYVMFSVVLPKGSRLHTDEYGYIYSKKPIPINHIKSYGIFVRGGRRKNKELKKSLLPGLRHAELGEKVDWVGPRGGKYVRIRDSEKHEESNVRNIIDAPTGDNRSIIKLLAELPEDSIIKFYHGTSAKNADSIIRSKKLLPDDMAKVGLATSYIEAKGFATRKDGKEGTVLEVTITRKELGLPDTEIYSGKYRAKKEQIEGKESLRYFEPEVGGSGKNEILVGDLFKRRDWHLPINDAKVSYGGQMKKSIIINEINGFLDKAEKNKRDEVKERLLGDIERFIQHYSKAIDKKSIDSINYFLKEYEKLTLLEQYDNVNRINNLYSTAEEINVSKGLNLELDRHDMINSISSVAHSLYLRKDTEGNCQYPILDELVQISKSYQKEYKNPGIIVLQDPAKLVSQSFDVELLQKGALERSSKFWNLFEKAIKDGIESLSNFEIIALREWLYAKA